MDAEVRTENGLTPLPQPTQYESSLKLDEWMRTSLELVTVDTKSFFMLEEEVKKDDDLMSEIENSEDIRQFEMRIKSILKELSKMSELADKMIKMREYEISTTAQVSEVFAGYEMKGLNKMPDEAPLFANLQNRAIRDSFKSKDDVRNPFMTFKFWIKAQVLDLESMTEPISYTKNLKIKIGCLV